MRASKENADKARENFSMIVEELTDARLSLSSREKKAIEQVREFLNAAKRKLPTEAAFNRDARRKRSA